MKKFLPALLLTVCLAAFVAGLVQLFVLRFDTGDVYPLYSSLRADPLGTMAIYESLEKIPGLTVTRDFSAANRLPEDGNTTYLHLAATRYEWEWMDIDLAREIDDFVTRGGRLVITFYPEYVENFRDRDRSDTNDVSEADESDAKSGKDDIKDNKEKMTPEPGQEKAGTKMHKKKKKSLTGEEEEWFVSMKDRWGVAIGLESLEQGDNNAYEPAVVTRTMDLPLPETLKWHSAIVFTNLDNRWHTVYARHENGVVVERQFGRGSVVLASDSWFLSNEALWKDRQPDLLAWLIGSSGHVTFDEAHLGVVERSGVAMLMRKYRLHGLVGALAILAGLFIWKNSVSLVPPLADGRQGDFVTGKDNAAGFVNLLRRNIPSKDVLNACFTEWKKSAPQAGPAAKARLAEAERLVEAQNTLPPRERTSVATYRIIANMYKQPGTRN